MSKRITNSTPEDIDDIFNLYEEGTRYQQKMGIKPWLGFERELVEKEIREGRQWKILEGEQIACVFVITFSDPEIWKERDKEPAVYIHRIATNPQFRGNTYVSHIVDWAKAYAAAKGKHFIRLDTGSGNGKLNDYYIGCGFTYLGIAEPEGADQMPLHYRNGTFSLFEISL